jgi:hypothetical protein
VGWINRRYKLALPAHMIADTMWMIRRRMKAASTLNLTAGSASKQRHNDTIWHPVSVAASYAASLPLGQGVPPRVVIKVLGQSKTIALTMNTYSQVIPALGPVAFAAWPPPGPTAAARRCDPRHAPVALEDRGPATNP